MESVRDNIKGTLFKWTNYISGWQPRWFVLHSGILSYYYSPEEVRNGSRGSFKVSAYNIVAHPTDNRRIEFLSKTGVHLYVKASSTSDRQQWLLALGVAKQSDHTSNMVEASGRIEKHFKMKMATLHQTCQTLVQKIAIIREECRSTDATKDTKVLEKTGKELQMTCDSFLGTLADCMEFEEQFRKVTSLGISRTSSLSERSEDGTEQPPQAVPKDIFYPKNIGSPSTTTPLATPMSVKPNSFTQKDLLSFSQSLPSPTNHHPSSSSKGIPPHLIAHSTHINQAPSQHQELQLLRPLGSQASKADQFSDVSTLSRRNSEAFVTPASSPSTSREGSPIPPTGGHLQKSTRETIFCKLLPTFSDVKMTPEGHVPTEIFLKSSRAFLPIFDALSPTVFAPIRNNINGDINKVLAKYEENPTNFSTLQALVLHDLESNPYYNQPGSATDALLWLKRSLYFLGLFLREVVNGEEDIGVAAGKAYTQSLRPHHGWLVRGIFNLAVKAFPYYNDFLVLLGAEEEDAESKRVVLEDMKKYTDSLLLLMDNLNEFFIARELDSPID